MRISELGKFEKYNQDLPDDLSDHPSMMSPVERRVLYHYTKQTYSGHGKIVDAGVFLGASTRLFGHALLANADGPSLLKNDKTPIVTFEHGKLGGGMPGFFERHNIDVEGLIEGTSFAPLLMKMISDVLPMVDLRLGDILAQEWADQAIEICFLDVIKSYEINTYVLQNFFPRLIPGKSLVVQQDYFIDRLPFLKLSQELLEPYFEYIGNAQSSGYFVLTKTIPPDVLDAASDPASLPFDQALDLMDACGERISFDPERHFMVLLSKVIHTTHVKGGDAGRACFDDLLQQFPEQGALKTRHKKRLEMALQMIENDLQHAWPAA